MSVPIHIEAVSQSKEGAITLLCHIDKEAIAIESSEAARIIYKNNPGLFNKLNSKTKFVGGIIYRTVVPEIESGFTRLGSPIESSKDYTETEVANISIANDQIVPYTRVKNQKGTMIDVDMDSLKFEDPSLIKLESNKRLTRDDVRRFQKISEILPLRLYHEESYVVDTFACKDYFSEKNMSRDYSYRMRVAVATDFDDYVDYVLGEINQSISFISRYISSIVRSNSYFQGSFKKKFSKRIFKSINVDYESEDRIFLDDQSIKNSDFGTLAINYYNAMLILDSNQDQDTYGKVIKAILPFRTTTLEGIYGVKKMLTDVEITIKHLFNRDLNTYSQEVYPGKTNKKIKIIESARTPFFNMQRNILGYYMFKPQPENTSDYIASSVMELTVEEYRRRFVEEQAKYYPSIDPGPSDYMSSKQRSDFMSGNRVSYITPERIVMGNRGMDVNSGVANIDTNFIADLKILKAAAAEQNQRTRIERPYQPSSDSLSSLGVSIGERKSSLNERASVEKVDPLVDASQYLGSQSNFLISKILSPSYISVKVEVKKEETAKKILSSIAAKRFLHRNSKSTSIKNIELANPNSQTRRMIKDDAIDLIKIPPQIKNMVTSNFREDESIDPLAVQDTAAVIEETQANVYTMVKLAGFSRDSNGKINLSAPKYTEVTEEDMILGGILIKAVEYENADLGIIKDNYSGTIYDNLTYVRRADEI
tara:strand:- start:5334 stop:7457 length:2124 start_codon:yes stop_codon:yes gene_type:complete